MGNISDVKGNIELVKGSYKKMVALGEGVTGDEFVMTIEGYSDLRYLIQSTQLPGMQRANVESFGPHGVKFNQQGSYINAQDVSITFKEVIKGTALKALREWVKEKKYLKVVIGLVGESSPTSNSDTTVVLEDCWIEMEAVDLGVEDGAQIIKPSGTLHANWVGWLDSDSSTVSLGS